MLSNIFIVAFISLLIKENNAGCNSTCQKECIDVINKYRINHQAKPVAFSQSLADKAQKWADGGRFGYDMKSRGKFGQLIEWDVKGELNNFTAVIKHWHDKERDFDFKSGRSRTGKTLHDFTQIVWKRAQKAGCGKSEIFGSKYYVVWMDSEGIFRPNVSDSAANVGAPKKEDLHWYETGVKRKPTRLVHSKLKEESSSSRAVVAPDGSTANIAGKVQYGLSKSFKDPDLNEMQDRQKALNIKPLLKQYLYHDSLNNIVLDENKDTASYHVVPGTEDKANWQKGAESLVQLGDSKSKNDKETPVIDNANVGTIPNEDEDVRKQASRFQSMVIQDDELLAKDAEGENKEPVSSEGNGGSELGETYEEKQADAIQSVMSQEDDMIQHENDDAFDESTGNNSSASPKMFQRKPISYFASGVALNNNPIASSFPGMDSKPFLDSSSVTYNIMLNDDATEKEPHNETPKKESLQSNSSTLSFAETKSTTFAEGETNVTTNKQEQKVGAARDPTALSEANGIKMTGEKLIANLNSQLSAPASSRFPQNGNTTGTGNTVKSTSSNVVDAVSSTSRLHQVTSPAVITLPNSSSRPIKLVFHLKDMKGLDRSSQVYQQLARMDNDLEQHLNDVAECHDDTLQCKLWATNGHCRGIAYAEFMKRHCKATCGYCGLPSIIKETSKLTKNISLSQDEPCEDAPGYEFSCAKWQEQGYCEKREKEMRSFCGRTCGFCVASHSSKGSSPPLPPKPGPFLESGVHLLSDKPDSNVYPPAITEKPVSMSLESLKASRNNALKVVKEGSNVSASNLRFGSRLGPNDGSISKQNGDSSWQLPKEQSKGDETVDRNQLHSQPPRLSQSSSVKVPIRVKANGRINLQSFSLNQNSLSQQFTANKEDELIEKGIKALQNRVQAPLEISAIAKSKPGCGHRLCKEKVKTQQAKTRATVKNRGMSGINTKINAREKAVATKGCDVRCQQECLSAHNRYRVNHRAPPLKLDQTLANQAQQWADKKVFKHSPWAGGQGGETIALGSLYPTFTAAVKAWHDEEKDYNWSTGTGDGGMKVNHFTQVVWKRALLLGCGRTRVNGEPYYIAQMDTPGVIAGVPGFDKSNVGKPKEPDLHWFMESSPYWKEMQTKDSIPKNVEHRILR